MLELDHFDSLHFPSIHNKFILIKKFCLGQMLNPVSTQLLQPMSSSQKQDCINDDGNQQEKTSAAAVGATWSNSGNLKIDLDNLLSNNKNDKGNALSMNQMASNPTSPINQPRLIQQNNMSALYGQVAQNYQNNLATFNQPNNQFFATFK